MKIGYLCTHHNKLYEVGSKERDGWSIWGAGNHSVFTKLYPDDVYADIFVEEPDFDLMNSMDAIIYFSTRDDLFIKYASKIKPPIVFLQQFGYNQMFRGNLSPVMNNKIAMDYSSIVWLADRRNIPLYKQWVKRPLFYSPIPYPVDLENRNLIVDRSDLETYDIIVAYGVVQSIPNERNGFVACKAAQAIINKKIGYNNFGVLNWQDDPASKEFLAAMSCYDFTLIPAYSFAATLYMLRQSKLCINLDCWEVAGKFAIDCALLKVPHISSDRVPYARELYPESWLVHPFDIDAVVDRAYAIESGCYNQTIIESAYNKAKQFDMKLFAQKFEDLIKNLPYKDDEVISFM